MQVNTLYAVIRNGTEVKYVNENRGKVDEYRDDLPFKIGKQCEIVSFQRVPNIVTGPRD